MTSLQVPPTKASSDAPWKFFGQSLRLRFIEPHVCHWVFEGNQTADNMLAAINELLLFTLSHPLPWVLCDLTRLKALSPEIRLISREASKDIKLSGIAFVGANFHTRVAMTLLIKGVRLMKREPLLPFVFVDSEEEAWNWLQKQIV